MSALACFTNGKVNVNDVNGATMTATSPDKKSVRRGRPPKGEERGLSPIETLPHTPQVAIGIDLGVEGMHVSMRPNDPFVAVANWPVWYISYEKHPNWRDMLKALIGNGTLIVSEPTGWNYLAPVAYLVARETGGELWLVDNTKTGKIRDIKGLGHKTDLNDARTLADAAHELLKSRSYAGAWPFDVVRSEELLRLRMLVNAHYKATHDRTRFVNRLRHLGHSIAPELNMGNAWFTCMALGALVPDQIHALDISSLPSPTRRAIERLRARLPHTLYVSSVTYSAILESWRGYTESDERVTRLEADLESAVLASSFADQYKKLKTFPLAPTVGCVAIIVATKGRGAEMRVPAFRSCLGVTPVLKESGKMKKSRLNRKGYKPAMRALHVWAQLLVSSRAPDNVVKRYFAGGEKEGGKKFTTTKARLALALRGVLRSEHGYDPSKMAKWIHDESAAVETGA